MPSKLVENKKRYLYAVYVGSPEGNIVKQMLYKYRRFVWGRKLDKMDEGEILKRYYELTRKEELDEYIISKTLGSSNR